MATSINLNDFTITDGAGFCLSDYPASLHMADEERPAFEAELEQNKLRIAELQDALMAESREGLIIVLQALDAAGKDSTIKRVLGGVNPSGITVTSFKQPSDEEHARGFLWKAGCSVPPRGKIAVFNRSYYEECLVVRVHGLWREYPEPERCLNMSEEEYFADRYDDIRAFERYLYRTGYRVVKIFLNVSPKKQKERFMERLDDESKNWKFSTSDLKERAHTEEYLEAFQETIAATATPEAPWYVIPANQKWVTRVLVSRAIMQTLEDMDPKYPELPDDKKQTLAWCRKALVHEDELRELGE